MAGPAILKIDIIADATKAIKAMEETGGAAKTTGGKFASAGKVIGGALAVGSVVAFGKASFGAAEESAQASDRLAAVYKSMGDTTGQAAKEAEAYAATLGDQIAVDDDLIKVGQAQLATFSEVSNETARAAGIFDRATAAGADLAAAGFGAIDTNAVQLGKALNDPIKGMGALAESGITFTDAQKEQITAMQQSGDILGAQKIILKNVETQVKGTAAATVTSSDKMTKGFGEVQEQVGSFLLPVMQKLTDIFLKYKDIILPVGAALLGVVAAVKAYELGAKAVKAAQAAWNIVQAAFNIIMAANPILLVVLAVLALIAVFVLAYMKVKWFRDFVDAAVDVIVGVFLAAKDMILAVWDAVSGAIKAAFNWVKDNWPLLLAILTGPIGLAVLAIVKHWDDIKAAAKAVFDWLKDTWSTVVDIVKKPIEDAKDAIETAWTAISDAAKAVFDWLKTNWPLVLAILTGPFGLAVLAIVKNWDTISTFFKELPGKIAGFFVGLYDKLIAPFSGVYDFVVGIFDGLVDYIEKFPGRFTSGLGNLASGLRNIFKAAFNGIANIWNDTVGKLSFSIPSWVPGIGGNKFEVPNIPTLATGGTVLRTGLAVVHAGEMFSGVGRSFSSGGNVNITVNTTGLGADAPSIQRAVANALRGYTARNGPLDIPVRGVA